MDSDYFLVNKIYDAGDNNSVEAKTFALWAAKYRIKWNLLISCKVKDEKYGNGIITGVFNEYKDPRLVSCKAEFGRYYQIFNYLNLVESTRKIQFEVAPDVVTQMIREITVSGWKLQRLIFDPEKMVRVAPYDMLTRTDWLKRNGLEDTKGTQEFPTYSVDRAPETNKKEDAGKFQSLINQLGIKYLYHFTDEANLDSINKNGGLYSWHHCENNGIRIPVQGGNEQSRTLDRKKRIEGFVHLSFNKQQPMLYVALKEKRIHQPIILWIDPEVIYWEDTLFSDKNAVASDAQIGGTVECFEKIKFDVACSVSCTNPGLRPFFQAEVMVKNHIPSKFILKQTPFENLGWHGFELDEPDQPNQKKVVPPSEEMDASKMFDDLFDNGYE